MKFFTAVIFGVMTVEAMEGLFNIGAMARVPAAGEASLRNLLRASYSTINCYNK